MITIPKVINGRIVDCVKVYSPTVQRGNLLNYPVAPACFQGFYELVRIKCNESHESNYGHHNSQPADSRWF